MTRAAPAAAARPAADPVVLRVEPPRSRRTSAAAIGVRGYVTPGATVEVAGRQARVRSGFFGVEVPLDTGRNTITVLGSKAGASPVRERVAVTRVRPREDPRRVRTRRAPKRAPRAAAAPAPYTGRGNRRLGTVTVPRASVLRWTHDGSTFTLAVGAEREPYVRSAKRRGSLSVSEGRYRNVTVVADGRWTLRLAAR